MCALHCEQWTSEGGLKHLHVLWYWNEELKFTFYSRSGYYHWFLHHSHTQTVFWYPTLLLRDSLFHQRFFKGTGATNQASLLCPFALCKHGTTTHKNERGTLWSAEKWPPERLDIGSLFLMSLICVPFKTPYNCLKPCAQADSGSSCHQQKC